MRILVGSINLRNAPERCPTTLSSSLMAARLYQLSSLKLVVPFSSSTLTRLDRDILRCQFQLTLPLTHRRTHAASTIERAFFDQDDDFSNGLPESNFSNYAISSQSSISARNAPSEGRREQIDNTLHKNEAYNWPITRALYEKNHQGDNIVVSGAHENSELRTYTTEDLLDALKSGDTLLLYTTVTAIALSGPDGIESIGSLPDSSFSELLRCLDWKTIVGRESRLFREISPCNPVYNKVHTEQRSDRLYSFAAGFLASLQRILFARVGAGYNLSTNDCRHALSCARAVGGKDLASSLIALMRKHGIPLDTECYNHYLASHAWCDAHQAFWRMKLRITPDILEKRQKTDSSLWLGYRTGTRGLKTLVGSQLSQMAQYGIGGDEETYCLMMVAQAREGDMQGVRDILKKVWNLDADLLSSDEALHTGLGGASPLRPTDILLSTVAHCFAINNQVELALRLVDHMSRIFRTRIPTAVWETLLNTTYELAKVGKRGGQHAEIAQAAGTLPLTAVLDLWKTMTQEPYNVQPTMAMYDHVIEASIALRMWQEVERLSVRALSLHKHNVIKFSQAARRFHQSSIGPRKAARLHELRKQAQLKYLEMHRSRNYIKSWVRHVLKNKTGGLRWVDEYMHRELPNFFLRWKSFLPDKIEYGIKTGHISFPTQKYHHDEYLVFEHRKKFQVDVARFYKGSRRQDGPWIL